MKIKIRVLGIELGNNELDSTPSALVHLDTLVLDRQEALSLVSSLGKDNVVEVELV